MEPKMHSIWAAKLRIFFEITKISAKFRPNIYVFLAFTLFFDEFTVTLQSFSATTRNYS